MDAAVVQRLNQLNTQFYQKVASSFSATRQQAWPGWTQSWDSIEQNLLTPLPSSLSVCDMGCGNARFAQFCVQQLKHRVHLDYLGIDQNAQLLEYARQTLATLSPSDTFEVRQLDIVAALQGTQSLVSSIPLSFSLVVGFGILHHIPSADLRKKFVLQLAEQVMPGGLLILACWQFHHNPALMGRQLFPEQAGFSSTELEPNDFFLTWERDTQAVRYAHLVTELEQRELVADTGLHQIERLSADGKTGEENTYIILQKAAW